MRRPIFSHCPVYAGQWLWENPVNPVCLVSVAAITGGFIRHCNRYAYGLTAARRAGPSMQTLGPLLQYTGCTKQRYTSYRGYLLTYLLTNSLNVTSYMRPNLLSTM